MSRYLASCGAVFEEPMERIIHMRLCQECQLKLKKRTEGNVALNIINENNELRAENTQLKQQLEEQKHGLLKDIRGRDELHLNEKLKMQDEIILLRQQLESAREIIAHYIEAATDHGALYPLCDQEARDWLAKQKGDS